MTIEEAAKVLRIGRTKAYALATEWRTTGGQSGLPVVDFGNVLRVPLCQLELLVGGELTAPDDTSDPVPSVEPAPDQRDEQSVPATPRQRRTTKRTHKDTDQLSLIDLTSHD